MSTRGLMISQRLQGASLLVFSNKSDVPACMTEKEIREVRVCLSPHRKPHLPNHLQGLRLDRITTHKWHIMACSAINGDNLMEGLEWVVKDAKDRLFLY